MSIADINFSRLVVGTVQFGMPYGIANRTGQPSFDEVSKILACALEGGATTLDTAAEYGDSESALGRALRAIGALDRVTIITKVRPVKLMTQKRTQKNVSRYIRDSVSSSLARLGIESCPLILFHNTDDITYMDILLELKKEGLAQHVGVSVGFPEQMEKVLSTPGVEAVQIPVSILDQRILRSGNLARAAQTGMAVFVRSIFLQGLLVMPSNEIIPELRVVILVRQRLEHIAEEAGLNMSEMALRYGLSLPGVTGVLTGVETAEQMAANVAIAARGPLPPHIVQEIEAAVPDLPPTVLSPYYWPGAKR
jgi:aryl-alcohol dehydrogenase-like predicted oxidoreductase